MIGIRGQRSEAARRTRAANCAQTTREADLEESQAKNPEREVRNAAKAMAGTRRLASGLEGGMDSWREGRRRGQTG